MHRPIWATALAATLACGSDPIPPPRPAPTLEWSLTSSDGRFQVQQSRTDSSCRVEARVLPDRRLWTSRSCVPPGAAVFLSPDGRRMLVLEVDPPAPGSSDTILVALWADGAVLREYRARDVMGREGTPRAWLRQPTGEAVRAAARSSPDGETIQLELADGRTIGLGFDGGALRLAPREGAAPRAVVATTPAPDLAAEEPSPSGAPGHHPPPANATGRHRRERSAMPAAAEPPPPQAEPHGGAQDALAADEVGLYRWEDDSGALHFGSGSQVPPRFRHRAVRVSASVGVMPVDRVTAPTAADAAAEQQKRPR